MYYPTSSGRQEQFMDYNIIYTNKEIHDYISGADVVAFDFETAPDDEWRDEPKAALDAHKAHIVGISLQVWLRWHTTFHSRRCSCMHWVSSYASLVMIPSRQHN
jgi:hypothetical protein